MIEKDDGEMIEKEMIETGAREMIEKEKKKRL